MKPLRELSGCGSGSRSETPRTVTVQGADASGNSYDHGLLVASTVLDFTPPSAYCTVIPAVAKAGDTIEVRVTTSEPLLDLSAVPSFESDISFAEPMPVPDETEFSYFHLVDPEDADVPEWSYWVSLTDRASNSSKEPSACSGSGSIDTTPPVVSGGEEGITVSHAYAKDDTLVTVTFVIAEPDEFPETPPVVKLGGVFMDEGLALPGVGYSYEHLVDQDAEKPDQEGIWPVTVALQDDAGNQQFYSPGTVTFDFSQPYLLGDAIITLGPPEDCPLSEVDALAYGSTMDTTISVDNVLAHPPEMALDMPGGGKAVIPNIDSPNPYRTTFNHRFTHQGDSGLFPPTGYETASLLVTLEDLAGNAATVEIGEVTIDIDPPADPDTLTAGRVIYHRIPWGAEVTGGAKLFALEGQTGAVEPLAWAAAYSEQLPSPTGLLGMTLADDSGAFGGPPGSPDIFALTTTDRPDIYLVTYDSHRDRLVVFGGTIADMSNTTWEFDGASEPNVRSNAEFVWDPVGERMLLHGGNLAQTPGAEDYFWQWTEDGWEELIPPVGQPHPNARMNHSMLFYETVGTFVVTGGDLMTGEKANDIWQWDGTDWLELVPLDPEGDGNPGLYSPVSMAWFPQDETVFTCGTNSGANVHWEWDGASWAHHGPPPDPESDGSPYCSSLGKTLYDTSRGTVLGHEAQSEAEIWEWNGESWRLLPFGDPTDDGNPGERLYYEMVFDEARSTVVLLGGSSGPDEVWWKTAPLDDFGPDSSLAIPLLTATQEERSLTHLLPVLR